MSNPAPAPAADLSRLGITVAVMTYNEAASLDAVVREIRAELQKLGHPHEIVIIDDGSTDGSGAIADRLAAELDTVRVVRHPTNQGLGSVYRDGYTCGTMDLVTLFPADGQFDAQIISQFLPLFDRADMVLGYVPDLSHRTPLARMLSWMERLLFNCLFGRFPKFQGMMMFRRSLLDTLPLTSRGRGWMVQMELILRFQKKGYRIVTEPTGIRQRMSGASKVNNLRCTISNLRQVLELRWKLWRG